MRFCIWSKWRLCWKRSSKNAFSFRLVLPRLMTMLEKVVIDEMNKTLENGGDVCEDALKILQSCQVHKKPFWFVWEILSLFRSTMLTNLVSGVLHTWLKTTIPCAEGTNASGFRILAQLESVRQRANNLAIISLTLLWALFSFFKKGLPYGFTWA